MKELSMHILDIVHNSIRAQAKHIGIRIEEDRKKDCFKIEIEDDGIGMTPYLLEQMKNPFVTTRKLRKVGLGLPLFAQTCEQAGGRCTVISEVNKGTSVVGLMVYSHIDRPPLGDMASTIAGLITSYDTIDITYVHRLGDEKLTLSTCAIREKIGQNIALNHVKIYQWIYEYLQNSLKSLNHNR